MQNKKGQLEFAIIKGLILALVVVASFIAFETISAKTPDGDTIECKWDCSKTEWGECVNGYSNRDASLCFPNKADCYFSEPKPPIKMKCD